MKRGKPFEPGNKMGRGRPKGSRNKRNAEAIAILDQYAEPLIKKCIAKALEGDPRALGLCIERILPVLREPTVRMRVPKLNEAKDYRLVVQRVLEGIAAGNLTPMEGEKIANIAQNYVSNIEGQEMIARIQALEKHAKEQKEREQLKRQEERRRAHEGVRQERSTDAA